VPVSSVEQVVVSPKLEEVEVSPLKVEEPVVEEKEIEVVQEIPVKEESENKIDNIAVNKAKQSMDEALKKIPEETKAFLKDELNASFTEIIKIKPEQLF
tara:strand:+ start:2545 stop:2841 length:297 start_codon:yes stop_codon:yes gene_type:complete